MLYIIGLGLNEQGISKEGLLAIEKCGKIYLESYTVDFPYSFGELKLGKKIIKLNRKDVESNKLIKEAKSRNIALLVYGCPLFATTHMSLVLDARKQGVGVKIIYAPSIFDAVAETGLQLYKFGKIASMPCWKKNYEPDSFLDYVLENKKINAHSLILIDIGLNFKDALSQLEKSAKARKLKLDKLIICSKVGTEQGKIYYDSINKLKKENINMPFCFVIPGELHFLEGEAIELLREKN